MSTTSNKQFVMKLAYRELEKLDPRHELLSLVSPNRQSEFELTDSCQEKYVREIDVWDFQAYARYAADLRKAIKLVINQRTSLVDDLIGSF